MLNVYKSSYLMVLASLIISAPSEAQSHLDKAAVKSTLPALSSIPSIFGSNFKTGPF